jgi:hypothetical protein
MEIVNPNSSTVKSTEEIIAKQIEEIKKMISLHDDDDSPAEEEKPGMKIIQINPAMKRHWELEIKTLREAPRDQDKLSKLLEEKHRQWKCSGLCYVRCRGTEEKKTLSSQKTICLSVCDQ